MDETSFNVGGIGAIARDPKRDSDRRPPRRRSAPRQETEAPESGASSSRDDAFIPTPPPAFDQAEALRQILEQQHTAHEIQQLARGASGDPGPDPEARSPDSPDGSASVEYPGLDERAPPSRLIDEPG